MSRIYFLLLSTLNVYTKEQKNYLKINGFSLHSKEMISKVKKQLTEWEKIFANHISRIHKELE